MESDAIIIGAGISGLSAASLLAKRGLSVTVIEKNIRPGGSCGSFSRAGARFDQGAAMLYGFGERGFNAHRFLFNCLEEPFTVIRHELLYTIVWRGVRVRFWPDIDRFVTELGELFGSERRAIGRFYADMFRLYERVIAEQPDYTTPDEMQPLAALGKMLRHPAAYLRFLSYLNISAEQLLKKYFHNPEIFCFFNKLTSTYCYATLKEAPAIMAGVMFVDNHVGGSYYPAGGAQKLPDTLEKVIEEHGGKMIYGRECRQILFRDGMPAGVRLSDGSEYWAKNIIYSGNVWQLYGGLIPKKYCRRSETMLLRQQPTYASVVLYALVDSAVIDADTCPVEMLIGNPEEIDDSEVTVYIPSIDDRTLCAPGLHTLTVISPSLRRWPQRNEAGYECRKQAEIQRLLTILERRFPGFSAALRHSELATPRTLERLAGKWQGAVAGPKQQLGQHMLLRQHTRSRWPSLFCCGESTVLGTGTPTVTLSAVAAANAVLRRQRAQPFVWHGGRHEYVRVVTPPYTGREPAAAAEDDCAKWRRAAARCRQCECPGCCERSKLDVGGIMRRVAASNFVGARRLLRQAKDSGRDEDFLRRCEGGCVLAEGESGAVAITAVCDWLRRSAKDLF